jgi:O-antigen ligase
LIGIAVLTILFAAVLLILPKPFGESVNLLRVFSIQSRIGNYAEGLQLWQKHPILGIGYNHIRYEKGVNSFLNNEDFETNHAGASLHSSFLIVLVTGGIIGLFLFIVCLIEVARISHFAFISTIFLSILSLTDNVFLHPFVLFLWLVLVPLSVIFDTSP